MKKTNIKFTRILSWTLSGSVIASSCSVPIQDEKPCVKKIQVESEGESAIPIMLSDHEKNYISHLSRIASKMIKEPAFAREFCKSPDQYLLTRSGNEGGTSELDRDLLKVTTALGDEQICQAILNNDINEYLLLMYQKGYLNDKACLYGGILTDEQKQIILSSLGMDQENSFIVPVVAVVAIFYAAVIAVSYVGVGYTVAVGVNAAIGLTVAAYVAAWTSVAGTSTDIVSKDDFEVWLLKHEDDNIALPYDEMRDAIDGAVSVYAEMAEEQDKILDVDRLLKTINLNVYKNIEKLSEEDSNE